MRLTALLLAAAFVLAAAPAALAEDYPKLKPGQWETTTSSSRNGAPAQNKMTMCTDETVQKKMLTMGEGMRREMCSKSDLRREGGRYVGDSVCKIGESSMTSHSVMTLTGDTGYKTVVNATYDPPFMGMKDTTTTVEGKYVGPCRDGLQPGDFVAPNGQKFNMNALPNRPPVAPPPLTKQPAQPKVTQ